MPCFAVFFSQNAVILLFYVFTIIFVFNQQNGVISTQKYLIWLVLPKSVCFVTYWLNIYTV